MREALVQDWMTCELITITSHTLLPEAKRLMQEKGIRRLPVVDEGKLVGIVTWGDIREAWASDATSLSVFELETLLVALPVCEVMTPNPITVTPLTTIARAAQLMLKHKIGGLPVRDHRGRLVGIITESDIFRMLVQGRAA
ncbi:MAG: CBS domain-containing protein [Anaerolineae bacterium]|nr:CBS domain-containing protein [Anaerolineae bacterium]